MCCLLCKVFLFGFAVGIVGCYKGYHLQERYRRGGVVGKLSCSAVFCTYIYY